MRKIGLLLCALVCGLSAQAANIVWVSFHSGDTTPSTAAGNAGFTNAPDIGYTELLRSNGHIVTRIVSADNASLDVNMLNSADLVIVSRSVPSGHYQTDAETAFWNGITTPAMILGGYIIRGGATANVRLGYMATDTIPDVNSNPVRLTVDVPLHPIFAGVSLDSANTMVNPYANRVMHTNFLQRGISVVTGATAGGGTVLARVGTGGDAAFAGLVIGEWQAGAIMNTTPNGGPSDTLAGHRLIFLTGSRESAGLTSEGSGIYDLTPDGAQMFLNAVNYMAPSSPPSAPSNLTAVSGDAKVTLSWTASVGATAYIVKRSGVAGGPYDIIATNATTSYVDLDVFNGETSYYVVTAFNVAGESELSNEAIGVPKAAPTGVTAVGGVGQVQVSWDAFPDAVTYTVSRSAISGGPYAPIASAISGNSYVDTMVEGGRTYYYVVTAQLNGGGDSGQSGQASGLTAPSAPTLTVSAWAATALRLAWTIGNETVGGYAVEQSTDGVNFTPIASVGPTPLNYVAAGLAPSTTYSYRIQATNDSGASAYSNIASGATPSFGLNVNFANGLTGQPANNPAPTVPGYAQDIGEVYALRTNGLTYGWDRDITVDGRWRLNTPAPDIRWATFNHLQKADPAAIWQLEIPVGFYNIYIVAGDSENVNSIFQFDIEGFITPSYTPATGANFGEFRAEVPVEDGQLTITVSPELRNALVNNGKINFIDIYPATPVAPTITAEPQDVTTEEFHPVSLTVGSEGSFRRVHQWYHDGVAVPDGTNATLSFPAPQLSDSGQYTVIITNWGGSVTSAAATLTVLPDTEPPFIVSVGSLDGRTIGVCFNELVNTNEGSAVTDAFSYFINDASDIRVIGVTARPDGKSVALQLESVSGFGLPMTGAFYVRVDSVTDLKGNGESMSSSATNTVFGSAADLGASTVPGSNYTCDNTTIELVGGGTDIWGAADQGYWTYRPVSGDFDARVRLDSLSLPATAGPALVAKAGLIVRETTAGGSPTLHLLANPAPPGRNLAEAGRRQTLDGTTASWGTNQTALAMPQWLRLVRSANAFSGYRSSNGVDWILFATTTQTLPSTLQLGLAVTAHTNSTLVTTGKFSNFTISSQPTISSFGFAGPDFGVSFASDAGTAYRVEYTDSLSPPSWDLLTTVVGDGTVKTAIDPSPLAPRRFYRVRSD